MKVAKDITYMTPVVVHSTNDGLFVRDMDNSDKALSQATRGTD